MQTPACTAPLPLGRFASAIGRERSTQLGGDQTTPISSVTVTKARQTLLSRLERILPEEPEKKLPDELVMLILERMMIEPQQPVHIQTTRDKSRDSIVEDPSVEKCPLYFDGFPFSLHLRAMAREAYFKVNTIRIDAPVERSPKQILRSELFTMPWTSNIYGLELVHTLQAEQHEFPLRRGWPRPKTKVFLEQRDVDHVVALLGSVKPVFPGLRRLTLVLTVKPSRSEWSDEPTCGRTCGFRRLRRQSVGGELCCMLQDEDPRFVDAFVDDIAPAVRAIDLNYAAFKWRVSCGHSQCKEWFGGHLDADGEVVRLETGSEHTTAVLRDWKMPSWA